MSLPNIDQDTAMKVVSWILTFLLVGAVVYCFPGIAVGFLAGFMAGSNKDKIQDWLDKNSPKKP